MVMAQVQGQPGPVMSGSRSTQSLSFRLHSTSRGLARPGECTHGTAVLPFHSPYVSKPTSAIRLHVWRTLVIQPLNFLPEGQKGLNL